MGGGGGKGETCATTGFRYFAGLHLIFCHSLDAAQEIKVGDKTAWSGSVTGNTSVYIDQYNLFGGEEREGGIRGAVDFCFGNADQGANGYLSSRLGPIPAYRGLFGIVANKCMLSANNPYIKEWSLRGKRCKTGWRNDLCEVIAADGAADMNPAHIIRECLVNTEWGGLGYPVSDLDDASFTTAANLLGAEKFGLSLLWAKQTSIEEFIKIILDHIDGVLYFHHITGLLTLRLIRNDYNIGALPVFNESNILEMSEFTNPSATETINQVTVNYVDRENQGCAVTVQDIAGLSRCNGQINAATMNYVGIANASLAAMVATRELTQLCMPIASCTLVVNRKYSSLQPGDCINFNWGPIGVSNMVMRISEVQTGLHTDSKIRITAVRDVFAFGTSSITTPSNSGWTSPISAPANAVDRKVAEITWWQFVREYAGDSSTVLAELEDASTLAICFCGRPTSDATNYEMWGRAQGAVDWVKKDTDSFPYIGTTTEQVVPEVESTIALAESYVDPDMVKAGAYAWFDDELVAVLSVDYTARTVTVARGVLDTVPVLHAPGKKIWFHQALYGLDTQERVVGEAIEVKMLPATSLGRLAIADATGDLYTCTGRMMRPYPPGNVKVNTLRWPESIGVSAAFTVSWAHRDRTLQTVTLNRQDEGDIGPEAGVTYTLRLYGETNALKKTVTGLTGTSYTWDTEIADSGLGRLNTSVRFELEAVRGTLISFNKWNITTPRL